MKSKKNKLLNNICFWLFVIAVLLLIGLILFSVYLYKLDLIKFIDFRSLLYDENDSFNPDLFWSALASIGTVIGTIATIIVGIFTIKISQKMHNIEEKQNQLYTEPHTFINTIKVQPAWFELSDNTQKLKGLKDFKHPFYNDKGEDIDLTHSSIIVLEFINSSEAFARLRFNNAVFKNNTDIVASFDMSTFGTHTNHIMVSNDNNPNTAKIGLLLTTRKLSTLQNTTFTISYFLDNNFGECFKETQNYMISDITDDTVSFYPIDFRKNSYEKMS